MGAKLKLETMRGTAPHCTFCRGVPRDDDNEPLPGATAEGVDVNWGDNLYICQDCIAIGGELIGMLTPVESEKLRKQIEFRNRQVEKLQGQIQKLEDRVERMLTGAKAVSEAKAERKKKAK